MGGGRRRHPVLPSWQQEWQLWHLWLRQDPVWRGGRYERVLGDSGVDVVADCVSGGVVDGEDLAVGESVLVQRGIQS